MFFFKPIFFIQLIFWATAWKAQLIFAQQQSNLLWNYGEDFGPVFWGRLSKDYWLCEYGKKQSPIDIEPVNTKIDVNLPTINLSYHASPIYILNNSHTIVVEFKNLNSISIDKHDYELMQMHFHAPAEHIVNGKRAQLEIHLVHRDKQKQILVLGLMLNRGKYNYALQDIFDNMPKNPNHSVLLKDKKVNPLDFFPHKRGYYKYTGSLTTPPCTEKVTWVILNESIEASVEQIRRLTQIYLLNNRPTQSLGDRKVQRKL